MRQRRARIPPRAEIREPLPRAPLRSLLGSWRQFPGLGCARLRAGAGLTRARLSRSWPMIRAARTQASSRFSPSFSSRTKVFDSSAETFVETLSKQCRERFRRAQCARDDPARRGHARRCHLYQLCARGSRRGAAIEGGTRKKPSSLFSSTLIELAPGTPSIRRSKAISGDARSSCRRCRMEPRRGPRAFSPRMAIRARPRSRHRPGHGVHNSGGD
jgi:hypothetical protein